MLCYPSHMANKNASSKFVRLTPDNYRRVRKLGKSMNPPASNTWLVNVMVADRLPHWERGHMYSNPAFKP